MPSEEKILEVLDECKGKTIEEVKVRKGNFGTYFNACITLQFSDKTFLEIKTFGRISEVSLLRGKRISKKRKVI